jgi:hypothetical protein
MPWRRGAFLLVAGCLAGPPVPAAAGPPPSELGRYEFCGVVARCGLPASPGLCPEPFSRGVSGVSYDEARCREPLWLGKRGFPSDALSSYRVYRFLGRRYRVLYTISGELPISVDRLGLLIDDLPLAARLLTRFQKTPYAAEYLDPEHRRFRANRGTALRGEAERISGSTGERTIVYFGDGTSELGPWKLRGQGLVVAEYRPSGNGKGLSYRLQVVATPVNGVINVLMNTGIFRSVLNRRVREILTDVAEASRKLEAQAASSPGGSEWTAEEQAKLAALLRLP